MIILSALLLPLATAQMVSPPHEIIYRVSDDSDRQDDTTSQPEYPEYAWGYSDSPTTRCINDSSVSIKYNNSMVVTVGCEPPTPYCDQTRNVCVKDYPDTPFFCDVDGHYPHVADCHGSYSCYQGKSTNHPCPKKMYFDYKKKTCRKSNGKCRIPDCREKNGLFIGHPGDQSLYVMCVEGIIASMHICSPDYKFSSAFSPPCEYVCRGVGFYGDSRNPQIYYKCYWDKNRIVKEIQYCPDGYIFKSWKGTSKCVIAENHGNNQGHSQEGHNSGREDPRIHESSNDYNG